MAQAKPDTISSIVCDAGGTIVGRTRLQKVTYLLTVAGFQSDFDFVYKHYGPFSEDLATAARCERIFGDLQETERPTSWGGTYSVFEVENAHISDNENRVKFTEKAAKADAIELELAATAVFLATDGYKEPWQETARRKPEKATPLRLGNAKFLLTKLRDIETPIKLPEFHDD